MNYFIGVSLGYLIGSIPTAYIAGRLYKGIDIREYGSGNVGATNVFRVLGKWPGIVVLMFDIFKGFFVVGILSDFLGVKEYVGFLLLAIAVVSGHNWTIFLKFRGGKGIATSLGVLIALTIKIISLRIVLLVTVLLWLVCFISTGIVSLSSIIASIFLPVVMISTKQSNVFIFLGVAFCMFVILRHRPNIRRLFDGTEPKVKLPFIKGSH